ncbi:hypothetical protein KY311_04615 [Candidatus Woesearchaeota archaeon]|nr:hypothetical protein [Candidatus Woesearchaeota archaeon]MBW3017122.1 hypothetical protein [Candidatus Woesearchaeota archaeon]
MGPNSNAGGKMTILKTKITVKGPHFDLEKIKKADLEGEKSTPYICEDKVTIAGGIAHAELTSTQGGIDQTVLELEDKCRLVVPKLIYVLNNSVAQLIMRGYDLYSYVKMIEGGELPKWMDFMHNPELSYAMAVDYKQFMERCAANAIQANGEVMKYFKLKEFPCYLLIFSGVSAEKPDAGAGEFECLQEMQYKFLPEG